MSFYMTTDEQRLGRWKDFTCPCCGQLSQRAYDLDGREVCGFCRGIGADGMLTGKHGTHPDPIESVGGSTP